MTFWLQLHLFCSKLSSRMLMILIEMKLLTVIILSHKCSIVVVKVLNTLNSPKFHFVKWRKLSVLCSKFMKNRKIKVPIIRIFQNW